MPANRPDEIFFDPEIYESQFAYAAEFADVPFRIQLAKTFGPKVLELACGAGRRFAGTPGERNHNQYTSPPFRLRIIVPGQVSKVLDRPGLTLFSQIGNLKTQVAQ